MNGRGLKNFPDLHIPIAASPQFNPVTKYPGSAPELVSSSYGKTSRHFIVRCREHLGINKKGISIKGASSSIRDHIFMKLVMPRLLMIIVFWATPTTILTC